MSTAAKIGRLLTGRWGDRFCECRRCGTNVDSHVQVCPVCGGEGIACYDL